MSIGWREGLVQSFRFCFARGRWFDLGIFVGQGEMDIHTANACKLLSVTDFSHLMDLILEFLSNTQSNEGEMDTCNLIHLSVLLLHGAPQGRAVFCCILSAEYR